MAEVVEPSSFATGAELVILAIWLAAAIAPVCLLLFTKTNAADVNIYLRMLGIIWLGPMSVVIVGMGANYLRMIVDTFKALRP